jgi:hypothetical protein
MRGRRQPVARRTRAARRRFCRRAYFVAVAPGFYGTRSGTAGYPLGMRGLGGATATVETVALFFGLPPVRDYAQGGGNDGADGVLRVPAFGQLTGR